MNSIKTKNISGRDTIHNDISISPYFFTILQERQDIEKLKQ